MKERHQVFWGILMAVVTSLIILGGALLSLSEKRTQGEAKTSPTKLVLEEEMPTLVFILPVISSQTAETSETATVTPTPSMTPMTGCPIPTGWTTIILDVEETTESLALRYGITEQELASGNCWDYVYTKLMAGSSLYVPSEVSDFTLTPGAWCRPQGESACVPLIQPTPSPTITPTNTCKLRTDWYAYTVRPGDTLYSLSRMMGVSIYALQQGNCMGSNTTIHAGQILLVPFMPPPPLQPTWTPQSTIRPFPSPTLRIHTPVPPTTPVRPPVTTPPVISTLPQHPPSVTPDDNVPPPPPVVSSPVSTLPYHPPPATPENPPYPAPSALTSIGTGSPWIKPI